MPRGVYKRKKKSKRERQEIAARAAATRKANREAAQAEPKPKAAPKRSKRFLSDDEKGKVVGHFFSSPGRTFANWDAVATEIREQLGISLSPRQAERLREAFSLPFDVAGQTEGPEVCEKRLARMEQMLAEMKATIDSWTE